MVERPGYLASLVTATRRSPVTALLGPRQCGKTTLARMFARDRRATRFDLESQPDLRKLQNPELVLGRLNGLVILDEIQVMPELFGVLRVLVDRPDNPARFLVLGSASPHLVRGVSETLAGRVEFVELGGFDLGETGGPSLQTLWVRGGFPRSFLAASNGDSLAWREGFIRTFLERDVPQLGITIAAAAMRRFWTMLAHYHGQRWNAQELGRSMGLSDKTVRSYLDILTGTFMVRQLQPWFENVGKRQVKAPKIYLRDSGLLHALLSVGDAEQLLSHPRVGASWEGFALEQVLRAVQPSEAFFWATHTGAELDLLLIAGGRRFGVEMKFSEAPAVTKSMRVALADLRLDHLWVIYPGDDRYLADDQITVWPLRDVAELARQIPTRPRRSPRRK
jgi:predicted AAA+ superfamily ATPase